MKRVVKLNENDLNKIVKRVISESQDNDMIEELLKDRFPEIVSVAFRDKKVILGSEGMKKMTVNEINVICDMDGYLGDPTQKSYKGYKGDVFKFLENVVGLDLTSYGSKYQLLVYTLEPRLI
jgi:hypothetical protein